MKEFTVYYNKEGSTITGTWETHDFLTVRNPLAKVALIVAQNRMIMHEAGTHTIQEAPESIVKMVTEEWSWRVYDIHGELVINQ